MAGVGAIPVNTSSAGISGKRLHCLGVGVGGPLALLRDRNLMGGDRSYTGGIRFLWPFDGKNLKEAKGRRVHASTWRPATQPLRPRRQGKTNQRQGRNAV